MNCSFCYKCLTRDQWGDYNCSTCNVLFSIHEEYGKQILFIRHMNNKRYSLNLFPDKSLTILVSTDESIVDYKEIIYKYNIPNVTPENAANKIKTLLVFS